MKPTEIKKLPFNVDQTAVSPVIGVILMVAITVILVAVIGSFVLGIGGSRNAAPQSAFTCDDGDLVHNGGEELDNSSLSYTNASGNEGSPESGTITAGDPVVTTFNGTLVWENPDGDDSQILYEGDC